MARKSSRAAALIAISLVLTAGSCPPPSIAPAPDGEAMRSLCRELKRRAPSFVDQDTQETKEAVAGFYDYLVTPEACGDLLTPAD